MLRPFPQYSGINADFVNLGSSNYNSLQITLQKRMSSGLTFNINHTWSKTLSDALTLAMGRSAYLWDEKTHGESDRRHVFNAMVVYELPFGRGRAVNPGSAVVRALVGGWRVSSITRIRSGLPYPMIGASCTLPSAGGCRASFNPAFDGPVRINGDWGSGDLLGARPAFLDSRAFMHPAPYTYGDTPAAGAAGIYGPGNWNEDLGVTRQFGVTERIQVDFSAEAFNVFNTTTFNPPGANVAFNNANFSRITGQQNAPRSLQFALKLRF
jgi:hypothetical protein